MSQLNNEFLCHAAVTSSLQAHYWLIQRFRVDILGCSP